MVQSAEETTCLRGHFPDAEAVYLLGPFNRWSTTATPMRRGDGCEWLAELPTSSAFNLSFFVWYAGERCGHLVRPFQLMSQRQASSGAHAAVAEPGYALSC